MLRLTTLGAVDLRDHLGHPVRDVLSQPKRVALLAYLAVESRQGPVSRDRLLALFWPESDEEHARNTLSQALHHLRQVVGTGAIVNHGSSALSIPGALLWCDAAAFAEALERGEGELALDLYRGEFCPSLYVTGAPDVESWLETQRSRLRAQAIAASRAVALRLSERDPDAAARVARRALAMQPDNEADVRALLETLEHAGDSAGALSAFRDYAQRLGTELDAEPEAETARLIAAIRRRRDARAASVVPAETGEPAAVQHAEAPLPAVPVKRAGSRWRKTPLAIAVSLAAVAVIGGTGWSLTRLGPPADPQLLVVAPFRVRASDSTLAFLSEGMADLVASRLAVPGIVRVADLRTVLAAWRRGGAAPDGLTYQQAQREGRRLGARDVVLGTIVGTPERLVISLNVHGGGGDRGIPVTVVGPLDSIVALADQLATALLIATSREPSPRRGQLDAVPLPALRLYLEGRSAFRAGEYERALQQFRQAVAMDSSFALAALGAAQAGDFAAGVDRTAELSVAWRQRSRLGTADRALLVALAGPRWPDASTMVELADAWERLVGLAPERPEAWYHHGDQLVHVGAWLGRDSAFLRAEAALARAVALDSGFIAPLTHLVQIAAWRDDTAGMRRLSAQYFARDSTSDDSHFLRWRVAVGLADSATARRIEASLDTLSFGVVRRIAEWSVVEGIDGPLALRAAEALHRRAASTDDRVYALRIVLSAAVAAGRFERAGTALAEWLRGRADSALSRLYQRIAAGVWQDGDMAPVESVALSRVPVRRRADYWYHRLAWALVTGQLRSVVDSALDVLGRLPSRETAENYVIPVLAAAHSGMGLTRVVAIVDSLRRDARYPIGFYNLLEARARLVAGDTAGAARVAARRPWMTGGDQYVAPSLRLLGLARAATGDTAGAIRAYRHYLRLRADPDPGVPPYVDSVRAALARLERR